MEETNQQPLALRVCAELAGSFLLCFAIYAFSTWGSAVYGINIVFFALATGLAYAAVTAIFSRVSGGQLNPAITVASVLVSKTKILDGILYVIAQVIGAIAAGFAVVKLLPTSEQVAAKVWLTPAVNGFENGSVSYSLLTQYGITFSITLAIVVEVVASLIVVATAMSSLGDHDESSDRHVIAMGLAYGLATAISYPVTGAGLNPARSTGIALAAMNEGLTQNPLQQLWVFWISPVLAAAVVALVMIIAQMMTTPKVPAAADLPQTDADANADTLDDGEFFDQAASSDGDSAEKDVAEESKEAEVGNQQADSQGDADEGVARPRAHFPWASVLKNQANKPGDDGRHGKYDRGGHRISESNQQCDDGDDAEYAPFKPWLALMCFGYIGMVVHVAIPSVERLRDHNSRRIAKVGFRLDPLTGQAESHLCAFWLSCSPQRVPISGRSGGCR